MRIKSEQEIVKYLVGYWDDGEFWASSETDNKEEAERALERLSWYKDGLQKNWAIVRSKTTFESLPVNPNVLTAKGE